jgi:hypothetical protein
VDASTALAVSVASRRVSMAFSSGGEMTPASLNAASRDRLTRLRVEGQLL